jgi:hypothetical protein
MHKHKMIGQWMWIAFFVDFQCHSIRKVFLAVQLLQLQSGDVKDVHGW